MRTCPNLLQLLHVLRADGGEAVVRIPLVLVEASMPAFAYQKAIIAGTTKNKKVETNLSTIVGTPRAAGRAPLKPSHALPVAHLCLQPPFSPRLQFRYVWEVGSSSAVVLV